MISLASSSRRAVSYGSPHTYVGKCPVTAYVETSTLGYTINLRPMVTLIRLDVGGKTDQSFAYLTFVYFALHPVAQLILFSQRRILR
jgi:hypothetical protein